MEIPNADPKYAVLKWKDWHEIQQVLQAALGDLVSGLGSPLDDAVVIRRQDIFAPPALDVYASSMRIVLEGMDPGDIRRDSLQRIADYFSEESAEAWLTNRKLPD